MTSDMMMWCLEQTGILYYFHDFIAISTMSLELSRF